MKTYVLTISEFFPKTHNKSTLPTGFIKSISNKSKKHTIRGNYELWKKRFEKINDGKAVLSVRYWSGNPYKSKQIESFVFGKDDGIGIERLILNPNCVVEGDMPDFRQMLVAMILDDFRCVLNPSDVSVN